MGFDIQRFIDQNIDREFICNICQDVLEDPLMISGCEHMYCSKCIRDCIKVHGVCPQDRSAISINKLVQPIRLVKNLLNKLQIRCQFTGCNQVFNLGELQNHSDKCEANPENTKVKCFCKQEFSINQPNWKSHKDQCLEYQRNELEITKSQLKTYMTTLISMADSLSAKVAADSEVKFLYQQLSQSLLKTGEDYTAVQRSLLFVCSKLLIDENETEKDLLLTIRYVKYGFEDLSIATNRNYDNCCDLVALNVFDYLYLCHNNLKNKHINRFIGHILKNVSQFEDLIVELMNKKCIKLLLSLMTNDKNEINTCIESAMVLSNITLLGTDLWQQQIPDYNRQHMLREFKSHFLKWKSIQSFDYVFDSFKELFDKMKSERCTPELTAFSVWLLAHTVSTDPNKYIPLIDAQNGFEYLKTLEDCPNTDNQSKRYLELVFNKWIEWKQKNPNPIQTSPQNQMSSEKSVNTEDSPEMT